MLVIRVKRNARDLSNKKFSSSGNARDSNTKKCSRVDLVTTNAAEQSNKKRSWADLQQARVSQETTNGQEQSNQKYLRVE